MNMLNFGEFLTNSIEKFEIFVKSIKLKIGQKALSVISFCIIAISIIICLEMSSNFGREKQKVSDSYNKTLYNLLGYMKNVEVFLEKSQITSSNDVCINSLSEVLTQSLLAKSELESLPVSQDKMQNISKYLTQTSSFSSYLIQKLSNTNSLSDVLTNEDYANLDKITSYAVKITDSLR